MSSNHSSIPCYNVATYLLALKLNFNGEKLQLVRDQPIMLIILPIMLCYSARKIYLLLKIMIKNKNCT